MNNDLKKNLLQKGVERRSTMKTLFLWLFFGIFILTCHTPCWAQGKQGKLGIGIKDTISSEDSFIIGGRYWLSEKVSLDGNFGFQFRDPEDGDDQERLFIGFGINQYLSTQGKFNPFIGVDFSVESYDPGRGESRTSSGLDGKFGGEYFLVERFSLSGEILLRLRFGEDTELGTDGRLGIIFYFE